MIHRNNELGPCFCRDKDMDKKQTKECLSPKTKKDWRRKGLNNTTESKAAARRVRGVLYRWGRITETLRGLHRQISDFEALIDSAREIGAQNYDDMPKSPSPGNPTSARAEKALVLQEEYRRIIDRLCARIMEETELKNLVDEHVARLTPTERQIVALRYGERLQWVTVAMKIGYSEPHVRTMDRDIIERLSTFIF